MRKPARSSERGSALVAVVLTMVALAGMSAAVFSTSLYRQGAARSIHEQERAFQAAMSGLDVAVFELREGLDVDGDGVGNSSGGIGGGAYAVTVSPAFAGEGEYILQAVGRFGPSSRGIELVVASESGLGYGLFGRDGITMSGSFSSDSYDSDAGSYASQVVATHAGDEGHLRSNGDINAGGGLIHGDATPGPGCQVLGSANVMGSTAPGTSPFLPDPYAYAPPIASSGTYSGGGTLAGGTHRYDDFTLSGSATLHISGDVVLYVDDKFTSSGGSTIVLDPGAALVIHHGANDFKVSGGGIVNPSQIPENVQLYSAGVGNKVELSGGSSFFGVVYAPEADFVSSGGSHLYGAVVAASATLSGDGALHFDTALGAGGAGGGFRVKSARKISPVGL